MFKNRKYLALSLLASIYSTSTFAFSCYSPSGAYRTNPNGALVETTPLGLRVIRNGFNENHSDPNCRIKLEWIDNAARIQMRRWPSVDIPAGSGNRFNDQQVLNALKGMTLQLVNEGLFFTMPRNYRDHIGGTNSYGDQIVLSAGDFGATTAGDQTALPLIHEMDHYIGFRLNVPYWTRMAPGHTPYPAPETFSGPGQNLDGSVMAPYTPIPAYEVYRVDNVATPAPNHSMDSWGQADDIPFVGKFFSTEKDDIGVFRPTTNTFYLKKYGSYDQPKYLQFGQAGDKPMVGDFLGTGYAQVVQFRPSNGVWYFLDSVTNRFEAHQWGMERDIPIPGDYFGTGRLDLAVFRPSNGTIYIKNIASGQTKIFGWGQETDKPVAGRFISGSSNDQIAQFRPSTGMWYIYNPANGSITSRQWGMLGDEPLSGKISSASTDDMIMFRPSNGTHYSLSLSGTMNVLQWGQLGDTPLAGNLTNGPGGKDNHIVFRNGQWWVQH